MKISGWGRYPVVDTTMIKPRSAQLLANLLHSHSGKSMIARGLGRSYGDSSLADVSINSAAFDNFLAFDASLGTLSCQAGVSFSDILDIIIPKGWFLPVTPGTKFITLGGAIASDVHGKNHHCEGSFCDYVESITLLLASGEQVICSKSENTDLFYASCGGMGLTAYILDATFRLKPIVGQCIDEKHIKTKDIEETIEVLEFERAATYSVAWIDCLSSGKNLGRSIITSGEHSNGDLRKKSLGSGLMVPVNMPEWLLNQYSIQAFNSLYYHRIRKKVTRRISHYEPFFYPLDKLAHWNRLYGRSGFIQYQFVLPLKAGLEGIRKVLEHIVATKKGSFLAVLKLLGKNNNNYLSFPMEGYTLALDFKWDASLVRELDILDEIVAGYGGRQYLTKDARMSEETFKNSYPQWKVFQSVRKKYGADRVFNSLQSQRLGI